MNWQLQCTKNATLMLQCIVSFLIYTDIKTNSNTLHVPTTHCCSIDFKNHSFINWSRLSENKFIPTLSQESHIYMPVIFFLDHR